MTVWVITPLHLGTFADLQSRSYRFSLPLHGTRFRYARRTPSQGIRITDLPRNRSQSLIPFAYATSFAYANSFAYATSSHMRMSPNRYPLLTTQGVMVLDTAPREGGCCCNEARVPGPHSPRKQGPRSSYPLFKIRPLPCLIMALLHPKQALNSTFRSDCINRGWQPRMGHSPDQMGGSLVPIGRFGAVGLPDIVIRICEYFESFSFRQFTPPQP